MFLAGVGDARVDQPDDNTEDDEKHNYHRDKAGLLGFLFFHLSIL